MTRSLFSVVIPTRNRRELLARALKSVRAQSSAPLEVIVVDDGSTDDTLEFLATQADVQVARSPGRGPGAARNAGAGLAAGEYLAFLDSDDLWFPWTLAAMAEAIDTHGRPAYVGRILQAIHR
jgi:glycosyltransferase involved in cell wall biosynthesis